MRARNFVRLLVLRFLVLATTVGASTVVIVRPGRTLDQRIQRIMERTGSASLRFGVQFIDPARAKPSAYWTPNGVSYPAPRGNSLLPPVNRSNFWVRSLVASWRFGALP
jgi:hypothetical protein